MNNVEKTDRWLLEVKEQYPFMLKRILFVEIDWGWCSLLRNLFEEITRRELLIAGTQPDYQLVEFVQIKEKFGALRAYCDGGNDDGIRFLIRSAEDKSYSVCEHCGGDVFSKQTTVRGWIRTLCNICHEKLTKERLKQ
jgi:hypothetical protein